jgi:hypothetical protein
MDEVMNGCVEKSWRNEIEYEGRYLVVLTRLKNISNTLE